MYACRHLNYAAKNLEPVRPVTLKRYPVYDRCLFQLISHISYEIKWNEAKYSKDAESTLIYREFFFTKKTIEIDQIPSHVYTSRAPKIKAN